MNPSKIKALLVERDITITAIARELGVSQPSVSLTIKKRGRSYRIEKHIADILHRRYEDLWGSEPRRRAA